MKSLFTLLACSLVLCCSAHDRTFDKLKEVNACWARQPEATTQPLPVYWQLPEKEWIRLHLALVEKMLRQRDVKTLSPSQKERRRRSLDDLYAYWNEGRFPVNDRYASRTPIFIDARDNFCAVGYLLKASGYEAVSRKIAAQTNLAYVMQMQYPELDLWAQDHGFTKEELAWIQPGYPPEHQVKALGKGVNGTVNELFAAPDGDRLYVGGAFDQVDSSINSRNIAYVTRETSGSYIWHDMAGGTNGAVNAIAAHDGKIFLGGQFTMAGTLMARNIAYWENDSWHLAGCLDGTVEELAVFKGKVYAAGAFALCAGSDAANLAYWNGMGWIAVPGLSGRIRTMEVTEDRLVLGGSFRYQGTAQNVIAWSPDNGFQPFDQPVRNTILDFELFKGALYAVGEQVEAGGTPDIFLKLEGNQWRSLYDPSTFSYIALWDKLSMHTLVADGDYLLTGGQFIGSEMMGVQARNVTDITPAPSPQSKRFFWLDSAVNKMIWFKGELIVGGHFRSGFFGSPVNGIGRRVLNPSSGIPADPVQYAFSVAPNPVTGDGVWLQNSWKASRYSLFDLNGKQLAQGSLRSEKEQQHIALPAAPAGIYFLQLGNEKGVKVQQKLMIR
ncbi:T9SS type A sorting domain-containing protein [Taibaiella helva]|uniref:T9SS type A sorting domain-containing protein n=1 Tax=Taibaiella helva TaxID=2301235 RepID=UPI0013007760|nr:T9SS type A sorting domain-containing protein [Taibaiella helva]